MKINNMSEKNDFPNKSSYPKNNYFLLSSWNYGSYSPCNPYFIIKLQIIINLLQYFLFTIKFCFI